MARFKELSDIMSLKGVKVAHHTLEQEQTGITAILPRAGNEYIERVPAGVFRLNGAGELTGSHQIEEWGLLETPIILSNSFAVGAGIEGIQKWMKSRFPKIGEGDDVVLPVVGECDDSHTSKTANFVITSEMVEKTLESALTATKMQQGKVGAGRGTRTFGLPGGLGSAAFQIAKEFGSYKVGVLVQSNFGRSHQNRLTTPTKKIVRDSGSIILIVATDAPLLPGECERLAKRACLGLARTGSTANHNSGELALAFSTGVKITRKMPTQFSWPCVREENILNELFEACALATEVAVKNAIAK